MCQLWEDFRKKLAPRLADKLNYSIEDSPNTNVGNDRGFLRKLFVYSKQNDLTTNEVWNAYVLSVQETLQECCFNHIDWTGLSDASQTVALLKQLQVSSNLPPDVEGHIPVVDSVLFSLATREVARVIRSRCPDRIDDICDQANQKKETLHNWVRLYKQPDKDTAQTLYNAVSACLKDFQDWEVCKLLFETERSDETAIDSFLTDTQPRASNHPEHSESHIFGGKAVEDPFGGVEVVSVDDSYVEGRLGEACPEHSETAMQMPGDNLEFFDPVNTGDLTGNFDPNGTVLAPAQTHDPHSNRSFAMPLAVATCLILMLSAIGMLTPIPWLTTSSKSCFELREPAGQLIYGLDQEIKFSWKLTCEAGNTTRLVIITPDNHVHERQTRTIVECVNVSEFYSTDGVYEFYVCFIDEQGNEIARSRTGQFEIYPCVQARIIATGELRVCFSSDQHDKYFDFDEKSNSYVGIDYELAQEIAQVLSERMGRDIAVKEVLRQWDRVKFFETANEASKPVDLLISNISITQERKRDFRLQFSNPYEEGLFQCALFRNTKQISKAEEFSKFKVVALHDWIGLEYLRETLNVPEKNILVVQTPLDGKNALKNDEADILVCDEYVIDEFLDKYDPRREQFARMNLFPDSYGVAVPNHSSDFLLEIVNEAVKRYLKRRTY